MVKFLIFTGIHEVITYRFHNNITKSQFLFIVSVTPILLTFSLKYWYERKCGKWDEMKITGAESGIKKLKQKWE